MKIAVTGYTGRLGSELVKAGCVPLDCDITNEDAVADNVVNLNPDVVINCASYTDVDSCESHPIGQHRALLTNFYGAERLRSNFGGLLIHLSTDYVFSGKNGPYKETDRKKEIPINFYGWSKLGAEIVLQTHSNQNTIIVRTTGLYGSSYKRDDFVSFLLNQLTTTTEGTIAIAKNVVGNQTYVPHLVTALMELCRRYDANEMQNNMFHQIIHIASSDIVNRYEFALMIASVFGHDPRRIVPTTKKFGVADRPSKGGLKVDLAKKLGLPIYSILDGLKNLHELSALDYMMANDKGDLNV